MESPVVRVSACPVQRVHTRQPLMRRISTCWRLLDRLDTRAAGRVARARAAAREVVWAELSGEPFPSARAAGRDLLGLVIDLDASVVVCHSAAAVETRNAGPAPRSPYPARRGPADSGPTARAAAPRRAAARSRHGAERLKQMLRADYLHHPELVEEAFGQQALALLRQLDTACANAEQLATATETPNPVCDPSS
jgi:hypothetical protein